MFNLTGMFNINTIKSMFTTVLNAIVYAAYEAYHNVCICNSGETSYGQLHTAFDEVVDMVNDAGLVDDINTLYDSIGWLSDVNFFCDAPEVYGENVYADILNAILYGMEQYLDHGTVLCKQDNDTTIDELLLGYYVFKLMMVECGAEVEDSTLYRYSDILMKEAKEHSNLINLIDGWYLVEKARITGNAEDAWKAVDWLHDQNVLSVKIEIDIG